jgi:hypothetical protein
MPNHIAKFVRLYIAAVFYFFVYRIILFFSEIDRIDHNVHISDIIASFWMGVRFDIVISGYILLLPFLIISLFSISRKKSVLVNKVAKIYINVMFCLAFLVCAIDIPFFNQFFTRISVSAFEWLDSPLFVLKMAIQEPRYWMFLLPFCVIVYLFWLVTSKIFSENKHGESRKPVATILYSILFAGLMLLGIRGRLDEKSPIRVGTAFITDNAFLNQLGLNPNFTLMRSYIDSQKEENKKVNLMDELQAFSSGSEKFRHYFTGHNVSNSTKYGTGFSSKSKT